MFTILSKNFNGRLFDRYFKSWSKAKEELDKDVENCCNTLNGEVTRTLDNFNSSKGLYFYEKEAKFDNGETCVWSLIERTFED